MSRFFKQENYCDFSCTYAPGEQRVVDLFFVLYSYGQQTAQVTGSVLDASGGAVEAVAIQLVNTQTKEAFRGVSGANGLYTIPLVKPGDYELQATATGFKQYRRTGIRLDTGATARLDVALEVGVVAESVTVDAAAPLLQTETSSVGSVVRNGTIANMPLIDRRAAQLARLNGFVVQNGNGSNFAMAGAGATMRCGRLTGAMRRTFCWGWRRWFTTRRWNRWRSST